MRQIEVHGAEAMRTSENGMAGQAGRTVTVNAIPVTVNVAVTIVLTVRDAVVVATHNATGEDKQARPPLPSQLLCPRETSISV